MAIVIIMTSLTFFTPPDINTLVFANFAGNISALFLRNAVADLTSNALAGLFGNVLAGSSGIAKRI